MDQEENAFKRECQLLRSEEIIMRKDIFELQKIVVHHQDLLAKLTLIKQTTCVNNENLLHLKIILNKQKHNVLHRLKIIYPITLSSNSECIRGLELPSDLSSLDDEHVSSVLGYVCHLTLMLSKYLKVPLRYELIYSASRSLVRDSIASSGCGFTFPLFRRETERRRFDKAVGFLEADIEQLSFAKGLHYFRRVSLLHNLKAILDFGCT